MFSFVFILRCCDAADVDVDVDVDFNDDVDVVDVDNDNVDDDKEYVISNQMWMDSFANIFKITTLCETGMNPLHMEIAMATQLNPTKNKCESNKDCEKGKLPPSLFRKHTQLFRDEGRQTCVTSMSVRWLAAYCPVQEEATEERLKQYNRGCDVT